MNWKKVGSRHMCAPYMVLLETKGYCAYVREGSKYRAVGYAVPRLDDAKQAAESHMKRRREAYA
jgi:hypothetical protein